MEHLERLTIKATQNDRPLRQKPMKDKEQLQKILTNYALILHWLEQNAFDLSMADFISTSQVVQLAELHGELDAYCEKNDIILG